MPRVVTLTSPAAKEDCMPKGRGSWPYRMLHGATVTHFSTVAYCALLCLYTPLAHAQALRITPSSLRFVNGTCGRFPEAQALTVSSVDLNAQSFAVSVSTSGGGSWLKAEPPVGRTPASVTVSVVTIPSPGNYTGNVILTPDGGPPQTVPVTLVVGSVPTLNPRAAGVVGAGDFKGRPATPGSIMSLFGQELTEGTESAT